MSLSVRALSRLNADVRYPWWALGTGTLGYHHRDLGADSAAFSSVQSASSALHGVAVGANGTTVLCAGDDGITRSVNGTDFAATTGSPADSYAVCFAAGSSTAAWCCGDGGDLYISTDGGANWADDTSGVATDLWDVDAASASVAIAVGDTDGTRASVLYTSDGGTTWTASTDADIPDAIMYGVSMYSTSGAVIVGESGCVLATTNGGAAWTDINASATVTGTLYGVHAFSAAHVWVCGADGLWQTTDGGTTWQVAGRWSYRDLAGISDGHMLAGVSGEWVQYIIVDMQSSGFPSAGPVMSGIDGRAGVALHRDADTAASVDLTPISTGTVEKTMPGGYGPVSIEATVTDTETDKAALIRKGWYLTIDDGGKRLWDGRIASVTKKEPGRLAIEGHGVYGQASLDESFCRTWWDSKAAEKFTTHADVEGHPSVESVEVSATGGYLYFRFPLSAQIANLYGAVYTYVIDDGMDEDGYIAGVSFASTYDVSGSFSVLAGFTETAMEFPTSWEYTQTNTTGGPTGVTLTPTYVTHPKCFHVVFYNASGSAITDNADIRYWKLANLIVAGRGCHQTYPTVKSVLIDTLVAPGLAEAADADEVAPDQSHVVASIGTRASFVGEVSKLAGQRFEHGVWADRTLRLANARHKPHDLSKLIVVGDSLPGLESWDVTESDEDTPDAVAVVHGASGRSDRADGAPTKTWWPSRLTDPAATIKRLDYSGYNLTDSEAQALAAYEYASRPPVFPQAGLRFLWHAARHDGEWPAHVTGEGTVPFNVAYTQFTESSRYAATATAIGGTPQLDGWNIPSSPACATFASASSEYVRWANSAALNLGTGARSIVAWVNLTDPTAAARQAIFAKMRNSGTYAGYELGVDTSGNPYATVCADFGAGQYRTGTAGTVLGAGGWYCICANYAGSSGDWSFIINGLGDTTTPSGTAGAWDTDYNIVAQIGARAGPTLYMGGSVAMVGVWSRSLSAAEAYDIYAQGPCWYERTIAKGQIGLVGTEVETGTGQRIDPMTIEPGWWVRHTRKLGGKPLYVTRAQYNLQTRQVALNVGDDRMEPWLGCYEPPPDTWGSMVAENRAEQAAYDEEVRRAAAEAAAEAAEAAAQAAREKEADIEVGGSPNPQIAWSPIRRRR